MVSKIEEALSSVQACIDNLDLYVMEHNAFGKGDVKKCKLSPDAFIQMALQLAYFKVCVVCFVLCLCAVCVIN